MAELYTITYTYSGQTSWTSSNRTVPWSSFVESGDTTRDIGQIVAITYEHVNNSHSYSNWALQGGIVLSDGTVIYSDTVTQYIKKGSAVSYTNTFTNLPTATQFNMITAIRTYASGSYLDNDDLTWRADSSYPMRVVVSFYEEEPLVYKPSIDKFEVVRGTSAGVRSEEGQYALVSIKLSKSVTSSYSSATLYYRVGNETVSDTYGSYTSFTSYDVSTLLNYGIEDQVLSTSYAFSTDADHGFLLVFTYGGETVTASAVLSNGTVALHISGCSTGGVAIGDISHSTEGNPYFEVCHPSHFYAPVNFHGGINGLGIQSGTVTGILVEESNISDVRTVTFPSEFSSVPVVVACLTHATTAHRYMGDLQVYITSVTTTGFSYIIISSSANDHTVGISWIAHGASALSARPDGN